MPKDIPQPVQQPEDREEPHRKTRQQPPLSGSKQVKNRNHSRQNHGEGS